MNGTCAAIGPAAPFSVSRPKARSRSKAAGPGPGCCRDRSGWDASLPQARLSAGSARNCCPSMPVTRAATICDTGWSAVKDHFGELLGAAHARAFHQHLMRPARSAPPDARATCASPAARSRAARSLDRLAVDLRHPRRRGALARRIGKDVQPGQVALAHQLQRVVEHRLGLGRETGDDIGAKGHVGAQLRAPLRRSGSHRRAGGAASCA